MTTVPDQAETPAAPEKPPFDLQQYARDVVRVEVYSDVHQFMDYCISRVFEGDENNPIHEDDINWTSIDTSDWDAEKLNDYLENEMDTTWEEVTGENWYVGRRSAPLDRVREYITEHANPDAIDAHNDADLDDWDADVLYSFIEDTLKLNWADVAAEDYFDTVEDDYRYLPRQYDKEITKVREYICDNYEAREPYEWWLVSNFLSARLKEKGAIIIDMGGGADVWGRETTGQAIYMDGIIQEIAIDMAKARGDL